MKCWIGLFISALIGTASFADDAREGTVYDLGSVWTTHRDEPLRLADLAGRPQVVALFFSQCTYACPRITADLKAIEAALSDAQRERAGFVMVSFDVERDTPEALRAFAARMGIDRPTWRLLHGSEEDTQDLAAVLGVRYRKEGEDFAHSNIITLLDPEGRIVYQRQGLESDLGDFIKRLKALL